MKLRTKRTRSRSPVDVKEEEEMLETSDLLVLYMWIHSTKTVPTEFLGLTDKAFVQKVAEKSPDDRFYIVHIPSKAHWIVADVQVSCDKVDIQLYDPLSRCTTAPLTRALRKIDGVSVQVQSLKYQNNDYDCGYLCLWILLLLQNKIKLQPMPKLFRAMCRWRLEHADEKNLNAKGDQIFGMFTNFDTQKQSMRDLCFDVFARF
jgi:hypothetical protein